jgi:hypothetical protein
MIKHKILSIFDTMTDNTLEYDAMSQTELRNLCNALSLDLQLLEESDTNYTC